MSDRIDIAVIRARVAAATPGPWVRGIARDGDGWAVLANDGDDKVCVQPSSRVIDPYSPADADLIAHAPADIAALCAEVERLRVSNGILRSTVETDEAIYLALALAAGFDHEPPSDARACIATMQAMATERDALRAEVERLRSELDDARNVALGLTEDCAGLRERLAAAEAPPTQRGFSVVCNCDGVRRGCTLGTDDEPCDCLCHDLEPRAAGEVTP